MGLFILWIVIEFIIYWVNFNGAQSAPQQCAAAAAACVAIIFPYTIYRIATTAASLEGQKEIIRILRSMQSPEAFAKENQKTPKPVSKYKQYFWKKPK